MSNAKHSPDLLFEVSWEVCNKVGGIHTVISTKAQTVTRKFADRYVLLGPDLSHEGVNPEFEEDPNLLKAWRQSLYNEGIRVRVGRWKIKGEPTVVLVDFSSLIPRKDEILKSLWELYHVDSISGQWDYIEPVLFGWAALLGSTSFGAAEQAHKTAAKTVDTNAANLFFMLTAPCCLSRVYPLIR